MHCDGAWPAKQVQEFDLDAAGTRDNEHDVRDVRPQCGRQVVEEFVAKFLVLMAGVPLNRT